ncbi:hypothetical protein ACX8Z9_04590 [Arthrobacter halodurans]|uniref:Uncharacterized protein n=1 Tax=Arthrobacter halodurans TaxID=516699 RepID=A0ABV4UPU8_9MICC
MPLRFNPPPNWPPPPPGWQPDGNWWPDPSWGPIPPDWPLWVEVADQTPKPAGLGTALLWGGAGLAAAIVALTAVAGPFLTSEPTDPAAASAKAERAQDQAAQRSAEASSSSAAASSSAASEAAEASRAEASSAAAASAEANARERAEALIRSAAAAESAKAQDLADRVEKEWLDAWMVESPSEIAAQRPEMLAGYVVDWESTSDGMVDVMLSVGSHQVPQHELDNLAHSIMTLVGLDVEDLNRVEVRTADWKGKAVAYRSSYPGLMP